MLDRRKLYRLAALLICLPWPGSRLVAKGFAASSAQAAANTVAAAKGAAPAKKAAAKVSSVTSTKTSATKTSAKAASTRKRTSTSASRTLTRTSTAKAGNRAAPTPRSIKLTSAFHASEQLRPMAQQLAATRSPAAYGGVLGYAQSHPGEGAAAAYLALAHAYTLDHRYAEAAADFAQARRAGEALNDYADYLGAEAAIQAGHAGEAYPLLDHFAEHYPDSIFAATAPVLLANAHLQQADAKDALAVLTPLMNTPESDQANFRYSLGRAYQLAGDSLHAAPVFKKI